MQDFLSSVTFRLLLGLVLWIYHWVPCQYVTYQLFPTTIHNQETYQSPFHNFFPIPSVCFVYEYFSKVFYLLNMSPKGSNISRGSLDFKRAPQVSQGLAQTCRRLIGANLFLCKNEHCKIFGLKRVRFKFSKLTGAQLFLWQHFWSSSGLKRSHQASLKQKPAWFTVYTIELHAPRKGSKINSFIFVLLTRLLDFIPEINLSCIPQTNNWHRFEQLTKNYSILALTIRP